MRRSLRWIFSIAVSCLVAAGAAMVLTAPPPGVSRKALSACQELPTRECLLDVGAAYLRSSKKLPDGSMWISPFAQSNRLDEAEAILGRAALEGATHEKVLSEARSIITRFRIRDALRVGQPLDQVLQEFPEPRPFSLALVARSILVPNAYLRLGPYRPAALSTTDLSAVRAIAEHIVARAENEPTKVDLGQLENAADFFAELGDRDRVLHVIALMKKEQVDPLGLREPIFQMVGSEAILELADESDRSYRNILRMAGATEPDEAKAMAYLSRSFEVSEQGQIWPDSSQMFRVIETAQARQFHSLADTMSNRLLQSAMNTLDKPFGTFRLIDAARARAAVGAKAEEVAGILARAEADFPKKSSAVVAIGFIAGPMHWGSSGLADEAYGMIAAISAEIGDVETAIRMLELGSDKIRLWLSLAHDDINLADLDRLLREARRSLSHEDANYITGQIIRGFGDFDDDVYDQRDWALEMARTLFHDPEAMRAHDGAVPNSVAAVACKLNDTALCSSAIKAIGQIALESKDLRLIMKAALATPPSGIL